MIRARPSPYTERQFEILLKYYEASLFNVEQLKHTIYQHNILPRTTDKLDDILSSIKKMRSLIESITPIPNSDEEL